MDRSAVRANSGEISKLTSIRSARSQYNLALSRRRAEVVQRYLVRKNIPMGSVVIVSLGEEPTPARAYPRVLERHVTG